LNKTVLGTFKKLSFVEVYIFTCSLNPSLRVLWTLFKLFKLSLLNEILTTTFCCSTPREESLVKPLGFTRKTFP